MKQISDEFREVACSQGKCIIDMQSTSLCTVQRGGEHSSRAGVLALLFFFFFLKISKLLFSPQRTSASWRRTFFVNCFLFWGGCTRRVMNLLINSYIKAALENEKKTKQRILLVRNLRHAWKLSAEAEVNYSDWFQTLTSGDRMLCNIRTSII